MQDFVEKRLAEEGGLQQERLSGNRKLVEERLKSAEEDLKKEVERRLSAQSATESRTMDDADALRIQVLLTVFHSFFFLFFSFFFDNVFSMACFFSTSLC